MPSDSNFAKQCYEKSSAEQLREAMFLREASIPAGWATKKRVQNKKKSKIYEMTAIQWPPNKNWQDGIRRCN